MDAVFWVNTLEGPLYRPLLCPGTESNRRHGDFQSPSSRAIILATETHAYERRFGVITCGAIMSKDVVTATYATELGEAWRTMRYHRAITRDWSTASMSGPTSVAERRP